MVYRIADEIVIYDSKYNKSVVKRFEKYRNDDCCTHCNEKIIKINNDGLNDFINEHVNLSLEQNELIYSLQQFFCGMLVNNKLLVHASVIANDNNCIVLIGKSGAGKSYLSLKIRDIIDDSYIISDDRAVIGMSEGLLCAWNTPWSKNGIEKKEGVPVKSICYIESGDAFSLESICYDKMVKNIIHDYPGDYREAVFSLLIRLISKIQCYSLFNDKRSFDEEKMRCIVNDL